MLSVREQAVADYQDLINTAKAKNQLPPAMKAMAKSDLYFLLVWILNQSHMAEGPEYKKDWLFDRTREVQEAPDGHIDLWSREHYKSTIITFGLTIFDILNNPEITIGIFSFNRPIAKYFLVQIKREFTVNEKLKKLFPEILWADPDKEAPKWSENDGIIVKRKGNPREGTLEAWGLVDGQPTSKHYDLRVYDDIITEESVTNIEKINKVTKAWELSLNLGKDGGRERYAGTHYHFADTYHTIKERGIVKPRIYPGTHDGTITGKPVLFTPEYMAQKKAGMSSYVFACQVLLNPKADSVVGFKTEWLRYWPATKLQNLNIYILVDPASSKKKKENDYTVMDVIGLGHDEKYYWIDGVRDRLNLTEKAARLFYFHRTYQPLQVGYEEYGLQADIEYIKKVQDDENYHFDITALGGRIKKADRIEMLIPVFQNHRFFVPETLPRTNYLGNTEDLVKVFIHEEYRIWPYALHDDMLDNKARILDPGLGAVFPEFKPPVPAGKDKRRNEWDPLRCH